MSVTELIGSCHKAVSEKKKKKVPKACSVVLNLNAVLSCLDLVDCNRDIALLFNCANHPCVWLVGNLMSNNSAGDKQYVWQILF